MTPSYLELWAALLNGIHTYISIEKEKNKVK